MYLTGVPIRVCNELQTQDKLLCEEIVPLCVWAKRKNTYNVKSLLVISVVTGVLGKGGVIAFFWPFCK